MESSVLGATRPALSESVHKTLRNTFLAVGGMMALTAATSALTLNLRLAPLAYLACFVVSLVLIFAAMKFRNSGVGLALVAAFSVLEGITLGPLLGLHLAVKGGGQAVAMATGLTALALFACSAYAIRSRRDFSRWGGFLFAGLLVLLAALIAGLFIQMPAYHLAVSAIGAVLFLGWTLYDVGEVVSGRESNYICAALGIYLDALNFFLFVLRVLGVVPGDD